MRVSKKRYLDFREHFLEFLEKDLQDAKESADWERPDEQEVIYNKARQFTLERILRRFQELEKVCFDMEG